jgi:di/tricarboxylate transporter
VILNELNTIAPIDMNKLIVLTVLAIVMVGLFKEIIKPSLLFFTGVVVLIFFKIVDPADFLKGYSNQQIATIVLLVVITSALRKNFAIEAFFDQVFKKAKTQQAFLWRMMAYVAFLSSFLNNTPIVAVMSPYVYNWCKRNNFYPSKMLIPLSFATILGGMITILGTSTNMVLNSFIVDNNLPTFKITDFLFPGICVTITGIAYLYFIGHKMLPNHRVTPEKEEMQRNLDYFIETVVPMTCRFVGGTVSEAGLLNLQGAYLVEIKRNGQAIEQVGENELILPDDILVFIGKPEAIFQLTTMKNGLKLPNHSDNLSIVEAVVPANSNLNGKKVKESNFKQKYQAEIIAVHRNGEKLDHAMADLTIQQGDLLLLSAAENFVQSHENHHDLYVVSQLTKSKELPNPRKIKIFGVGFVFIIGLTVAGYFPLFTALMFIICMFLMLNMFSIKEIGKEIDIDLVVLLVCSLTLSSALIKTGAAETIASQYIALFLPLGKIGILVGLFFITVFMTSFISNVGTISVIFPITYSIATNLQTDGTPFFLAIAFAASADFITPIGYQTNWMVYGPGGYSAKDFFKVGFPLVLIYSVVFLSFVIVRYDMY